MTTTNLASSSSARPLDLSWASRTADNATTASRGCSPLDTLVPIVTTSSVLGLKYNNGILMVADTLASYGRMTRFKDTSRFFQLGCHTAIATSGDYSDHQYMQRALIQYAVKDFLHDDQCMKGPHQYAALLSRLMYQKRNRFNPWWLSVVIGGYQKENTNVLPSSLSFTSIMDTTSTATAASSSSSVGAAAGGGGAGGAGAAAGGGGGGGMIVEQETEQYRQKKKKGFILGYVDMHGTFYEEDIVATGLGRYFAITLMRARHRPDMDEEEARSLLEECMRVLFYRDCGASNRIQFTKVTEEGVTMETPYYLDSKWDYASYTMKTLDMGLAGSAW